MMEIRETLSYIGEKIKRMNQVILAFPVWLVLGISGLFRTKEEEEGWKESKDKSDRYDRMY